MPPAGPSPAFLTDFHPVVGQPTRVAPDIIAICAPNGGPYTFTGTNSYLVGEDDLLIIDPGPAEKAHLDALERAIGGRRVQAILLTHTHTDHSRLAPELARRTGAPIWFGGRHRLSRPRRPFEVNLIHGSCDWALRPDRTLADGDMVETGNTRLQVIETPGHCANHLAFGVVGTPYLFSGDHVMGWNSTLVATPDGSMAAYFASLEKLLDLDWSHYFPGHGAPIAHEGADMNAKSFSRALLNHRRVRNRQILEAIGRGAQTVRQVVAAIYPEAGTSIRIAAAMTVQAHVEYLCEHGKLTIRRRLFRPALLGRV